MKSGIVVGLRGTQLHNKNFHKSFLPGIQDSFYSGYDQVNYGETKSIRDNDKVYTTCLYITTGRLMPWSSTLMMLDILRQMVPVT